MFSPDRIKDLQEVATAAGILGVAHAMNQIADGRLITNSTAVIGADTSTRVLFFGSHPDAGKLPSPMTARDAAEDLFLLSENGLARHGKGSAGQVHAWRIEKIVIDEKDAIVAIATWL